jgi:hypothetical protein
MGRQQDLLVNLLIGVVGAVVGGVIAGLLGIAAFGPDRRDHHRHSGGDTMYLGVAANAVRSGY